MADVRMADTRWACLTVERLKEERTPIDPILKKAGPTHTPANLHAPTSFLNEEPGRAGECGEGQSR